MALRLLIVVLALVVSTAFAAPPPCGASLVPVTDGWCQFPAGYMVQTGNTICDSQVNQLPIGERPGWLDVREISCPIPAGDLLDSSCIFALQRLSCSSYCSRCDTVSAVDSPLAACFSVCDRIRTACPNLIAANCSYPVTGGNQFIGDYFQEYCAVDNTNCVDLQALTRTAGDSGASSVSVGAAALAAVVGIVALVM